MLHFSKDGVGLKRHQKMVTDSYTAHQGYSCFGISWKRVSLSELKSIAFAFPGKHLAVIFRLMANGMRTWSTGLPDLLIWRVPDQMNDRDLLDDDYVQSESGAFSSLSDPPAAKDCGVPSEDKPMALLVEVKGPHDRLRDQQEAWIGCMVRAGINVEVCHVRDSTPKPPLARKRVGRPSQSDGPRAKRGRRRKNGE